ncbi:aspartate--tRNA ligase [Candidatus Sumerlaeota bacterium]|nr:aspartate--tRNA ligase [Candidatus Sumerlaeota bacterium]
MSTALEFAKRTMYCGEVRASHTGKEIILKGWVHRRRDHGRLMFIDLRDRTGLMQIRINPDSLENDAKLGVDADIAFAGNSKELVEALQNLGSQQFKLRSISKGDVNIFPDGREPKAGNHPYSARFMAEDRGAKGIDSAAADSLAKLLADKGHTISGKWFVSSTHDLREEYVIAVRGIVERRPDGATNPNLPTGETELVAKEIKILNSASALPFRLDEHAKTNEELRLTYRYLDLRRPELQRHFIVRDKLYKAVRDYLTDKGFIEFETPILGKPTPEGARDFLVPSRLNAGLMYALPQSPQLFKQILMVAGFDRYFQIARCFRDEDLRANRQPEFTQVDIEMSFVTVDDVIEAMEGLAKAMWKGAIGYDVVTPIQRLPYAEAISRYGSDKPDLRFGMELQNLTDLIKGRSEFGVFNEILDAGGAIVGIVHKGGAEKYSNTALRLDGDFQKKAQRETGCKGAAWFRVTPDGDIESSIARFFPEAVRREIVQKTGLAHGDIMFMIADKKLRKAQDIAGRLRLMIGKDHNLIDKSQNKFVWIVDFPLFDWNDDEKRWDPAHHPFTSPHPDDLHKLETSPGEVRALAYDLALNGEEIAGGSIRIHNNDVQQRIFKSIGISDEDAQRKFGFLLEALKFGAPPHGGIAFGFDRCIMSLLDVDSIREVIAFPKTQTGTCMMTGAPGDVDEKQLKELHIKSIARKDDHKKEQG